MYLHKKMTHISLCNSFDIDIFICNTYQLAKFRRLPFLNSNTIASHCFDLIYMNLWGPYKTPSITGDSYILTNVDNIQNAHGNHLSRWCSLDHHLLNILEPLVASFM